MKKCKRCHKIKPKDDFYVHKAMADGRLSYCKVCTKKRVARHRKRNIDQIRSYDRERGQDPKRKAAVRKAAWRYSKNQSARTKRWQQDHPEARAAHILTGNAIRSGLVQVGVCERCGAKRVHAHHEDYFKPLDITWLCPTHHGERHRELNEEKRKSA